MKYTTIILIILIPGLALADKLIYTPLVGVPGVSSSGTDFNEFINALYVLSISVAALLAVIKIIIAGVKWMLTDVVTSKGEAKKDIQSALLGLIVVLAAVIVLTTINAQLVNVDLSFEPLKPADFKKP